MGALDWAELGHSSALFGMIEHCWDSASTTRGLISLSWGTELLGGWVLHGTEVMVHGAGRALLGNGTGGTGRNKVLVGLCLVGWKSSAWCVALLEHCCFYYPSVSGALA